MGWFGAGYPHKPQWNGIWWVASLAELGSTEGVIRALQDDSSEAKVDLQDALAAALEAGDYQAAVNAASPLTAKKTAEAAAAHLRGLGGDRLTGQGDDDPVFLPLVSAFAWPPAPPAPPAPSLQPIKVPSLATTSVLGVVGFRQYVCSCWSRWALCHIKKS